MAIPNAHAELLQLCNDSGLFETVTDQLQPAIASDTLPMCIVWLSEVDFGEDKTGREAGLYYPETTHDVYLVPAQDASIDQLDTMRNALISHIKANEANGTYWTAIKAERHFETIGAKQVWTERLVLSYNGKAYDYRPA